jgi:mannosyltransferase
LLRPSPPEPALFSPGRPAHTARGPVIPLALGLLCLAGLLLRLYRLTHQSFWNDEILTVHNASGSVLEALSGNRDRNIFPLYSLLIRGLLSLMPAEFWLRLPSVLFGTLSIPVYYLLLRRWGGAALGLSGAALLAFSPFHVWYSQEARPYTLLLLLSLVALHLLQLAVDRPSRARRAVAAVATAATFYCHTIGLGFVLFALVYVALVVPKLRWRTWVPTGIGLALLLVPGVIRLLVVPPVGSADVYKPVTIWSLGYTAWAFGSGYSLGPSATQVLRDPALEVVTDSLAEILAVGGFLGGLLVSGVRVLRREPVTFRVVLAWLALPLGFALAGALGTVHPLNVRYAMLSFPAYLALLAAGLRGIPAGWRRDVAWVLLAGVCLWSLGNYFFEPRYWRNDNRSAGRFLATQARPGDLVVATAGYTAQNLRYYYRPGPAVPIAAYPAVRGEPVLVEGPGLGPVVVGARYVVPHAVPEHLSRLTAGRERVWLFASRTYHSDPDGLIPAWLNRHLCRTAVRQWPGVELQLYVRAPDRSGCPGQ